MRAIVRVTTPIDGLSAKVVGLEKAIACEARRGAMTVAC
jgi:hypothetical protein